MLEIVSKAADEVGGVVALARRLNLKNHNTFYSWRRVLAEWVLDIEEITGVSRHEIRPDVFGEREAAE